MNNKTVRKPFKNFYAVILAGGSGTRFWPLSREEQPKQFLNITAKATLLQETIRRISSLVHPKNVLVVTNKRYQKIVESQLKGLNISKNNILCEPNGKNTAPAICWAAALIQQKDPHAIMGVFPSDHFILEEKNFLEVVKEAYALAEEEFLVTVGIVPTRPETGFGYLKTKVVRSNGHSVFKVNKFIEKPNAAKAAKLLKAKNYLWNSGMFFWKTSVILKAFEELLPQVYKVFAKPTLAHVQKVWSKLPSISIDYAILEKSGNVVTVPAPSMGWSDLGSWQALFDLLPKDKNGNVCQGDHIAIDCSNNLLISKKRLVVSVGLKDFAVIETPDALLICPLNLSQRVKDVVQVLKTQNRSEGVTHNSLKKSF